METWTCEAFSGVFNHDKKLQKVWKKEIKTFLEIKQHFIVAVLKPLIETTAAKRESTGWWSQKGELWLLTCKSFWKWTNFTFSFPLLGAQAFQLSQAIGVAT